MLIRYSLAAHFQADQSELTSAMLLMSHLDKAKHRFLIFPPVYALNSNHQQVFNNSYASLCKYDPTETVRHIEHNF